MTLIETQSKQQFDAIAFNIDLKLWPNYRVKYIHAAYKLDINFSRAHTFTIVNSGNE